MKKLAFRLPLSGGEITQIPVATAYAELTSDIKWTYKNAEEMFRDCWIGGPPAVKQSNRYLYSLNADALRRNAARLGINVTKHANKEVE